jgi:hypothetical protein
MMKRCSLLHDIARFWMVLLLTGSSQWDLVQTMSASPRPYNETLPDGTVVQLRLIGDEFFHYEADEAGAFDVYVCTIAA